MPARSLSRNVLLSVFPWVVPTVASVLTIPIVVRGLGDDGYGLVALVGAVSGYLGLARVGLSQGIIRYVALFVSSGHGRAIRQCLRAVLMWFSAVGVIGGLAMWALAPWLVTSLLKVPTALWPEAIAAFRIGGVSFAIGSMAGPLSVVPNAFLRYDLVAIIQTTLMTAGLVGPAILVMLGYGLLPVMWLGLVLNGLAVVVWSVVDGRLVPSIPDEGPAFSEYRRSFIGYVLFTGANQIATLVQSQTNKLVVGIVGGTSQAAYYQVPYTMSDRANDLLNNMANVLVPTMSQLVAGSAHERIISLYRRSSRLLYVLNASMTGAIVVFSAPLLYYWISPRYAAEGGSALALFVLAQGVMATNQTAGKVNAALGHPKVSLVISLLTLGVNLALVYGLTVAYGITGTALSILIAAFVTAAGTHYTNRRILKIKSWPVFRECYLRTTLIAVAVTIASWFTVRPLASSLLTTIVLLALVMAIIVILCAVAGVITPADRASIKAALRRTKPSAPVDADS